MKGLRLAVVALAALATSASAQSTPTGVWKAVFAGPPAARPKVPAYFEIDIRQGDRSVTGTVRADRWLQDGVISDATIDGNHVTFTSVMEKGWWSTTSGGVRVDHCCPKLIFDATIDGDKMSLTLTWSSTEVSGGAGTKYPMEATRLSR